LWYELRHMYTKKYYFMIKVHISYHNCTIISQNIYQLHNIYVCPKVFNNCAIFAKFVSCFSGWACWGDWKAKIFMAVVMVGSESWIWMGATDNLSSCCQKVALQGVSKINEEILKLEKNLKNLICSFMPWQHSYKISALHHAWLESKSILAAAHLQTARTFWITRQLKFFIYIYWWLISEIFHKCSKGIM